MTILSLFRNRLTISSTSPRHLAYIENEMGYRTRILAEEVDNLKEDNRRLMTLIQGLTHVVGLIQQGDACKEKTDLLVADIAGVSLDAETPDSIVSRE